MSTINAAIHYEELETYYRLEFKVTCRTVKHETLLRSLRSKKGGNFSVKGRDITLSMYCSFVASPFIEMHKYRKLCTVPSAI